MRRSADCLPALLFAVDARSHLVYSHSVITTKQDTAVMKDHLPEQPTYTPDIHLSATVSCAGAELILQSGRMAERRGSISVPANGVVSAQILEDIQRIHRELGEAIAAYLLRGADES